MSEAKTVQPSAVQHSTDQHSTVRGSTVQNSTVRRRALRVLGLWTAVAALLTGVGSATAAPAATAASAATTHRHAVKQALLPGTWDVSVTVDGAGTGVAYFTFLEDHRLTAEVPPRDGRPGYQATGYWNTRPNGTFAMYVTHPGDPGSANPGVVQAVHLGKLVGRTFTSTAFAYVTTADGAVHGPIEVSTQASRSQ